MNILGISLDLLLLLVLIPAQSQLTDRPFLLVVPLLGTVLLELSQPLRNYTKLTAGLDRNRISFLIRLGLLLLMIAGACLVPTLENITNRLVTPIEADGYSPALANVHDGALQLELALGYLQQGKNPYVEQYDQTPLKFYGFKEITLPRNPTFDYFVYLPSLLWISYPFYALFHLAGFPYDERWVFLFVYFLLILILPTLARRPEYKLLLVAAIGLNPLLTGPVKIGMDDVAILLFLILVAKTIEKRPLLAAILFGIACSLKQSAWFIIPFYFLYLFLSTPPKDRIKQVMKSAVTVFAVMAISAAPLALRDLHSFLTDTLMYPAGLVGINYPIRGYTLGMLLISIGLIPSPASSFPFWILEGLFGIPLLLLLLHYQQRRNSVGIMFQSAGIFIFGFGFLTRFFQDNYVGFVTVLIVLGVILEMDRLATSRSDLNQTTGQTIN
ncbi:MAG: hypothetical protein WCF84_14540 [Anaerolineae bacterium]